MPELKAKVVSARLLNGDALPVVRRDGGITLRLEEKNLNELDTIVVLELEGDAESLEPVAVLKPAA